MDNRILYVQHDKSTLDLVTETIPSDLHRMHNLQSNGSLLLCQEDYSPSISHPVSTMASRQTMESDHITDSISSRNAFDSPLNDEFMLSHYLNHPLNLLPYYYYHHCHPNTSMDKFIYPSDTQHRNESSPPQQMNHFCNLNHTETINSSTPSKVSKKFRSNSSRSTHHWTCICPYSLNGINECTDKQVNFDTGRYFSSNENQISTKGNFKRDHGIHDQYLQSNAINLSLSSSSSASTSSPYVSFSSSSSSFECARSFIRLRNARERERVRCVNAGYESLRRHLPLTVLPDRRLAKVEILRGAINYINALKKLLENNN
ncbi:unnamed protein product [Heterobilharzia americana]|nr:unnamed protein product [Heterobilharzia americana]CAH8582128.1 unnamed protein product [Heterobilharzia americana]